MPQDHWIVPIEGGWLCKLLRPPPFTRKRVIRVPRNMTGRGRFYVTKCSSMIAKSNLNSLTNLKNLVFEIFEIFEISKISN